MPHALKSEPSPVVAELVKRCHALCQNAESALPHLAKDRGDFLSVALGDVLTQLELVLRAVAQEPGEPQRAEERKSLLRRLFGRSQVEVNHPHKAPSFDVSQQGLQGNTATVQMGELLSFLAMGRKTGVLWIDTPQENFMVCLVNGSVRHAASNHTPEGARLGEVLVGLGHLTRRQLERFVEQTKQEKNTISGELLVQHGIISTDELQTALKQQVQALIQLVLSAKPALFRFREGMEILMAHHVDLEVNRLLLESARVHDESANAGLRQSVVSDSWSSWQDQLKAEVVAATGTSEGAANKAGATEAKGAGDAKTGPAA